nr:MAG TPA: hypothetical protein [Bacteriophage sp.]
MSECKATSSEMNRLSLALLVVEVLMINSSASKLSSISIKTLIFQYKK